jgi:SAM-dependent methyltransferase
MSIFLLSFASSFICFAAPAAIPTASIPYVPTQADTVRDLLWLANVGTNDVVYDLGSGDGRVVIAAVRDFHARRAVGIEAEDKLVQESRANAANAGVRERVEFVRGDLFKHDLSAATVVVLYLGAEANLDLRAKLVRTLQPGARIVSHQFSMGEWPSDKRLELRAPVMGMFSETENYFATNADVPGYNNLPSHATHDTISLWTVPAAMAGTWRGEVDFGNGKCDLMLALHQRISGVSGTFALTGRTNASGGVRMDLRGDQVRLICNSTNRPFGTLLWFDGVASGDTMSGTLRSSPQQDAKRFEWSGRRSRADFSGKWEWNGHNGRPMQLTIERKDGRWMASYFDEKRDVSPWHPVSKPATVMDFYDFGGGFYFTLLLGLEGTTHVSTSTRMGVEDGWLIGEALAVGDGLEGNIAFYPYPLSRLTHLLEPGTPVARSSTNEPPQIGRRTWSPKRVR